MSTMNDLGVQRAVVGLIRLTYEYSNAQYFTGEHGHWPHFLKLAHRMSIYSLSTTTVAPKRSQSHGLNY
jgi:hypothetical protein